MEFNIFLRIIIVILSISWLPCLLKPWKEKTFNKIEGVLWTIIIAIVSLLATATLIIVACICYNFIIHRAL